MNRKLLGEGFCNERNFKTVCMKLSQGLLGLLYSNTSFGYRLDERLVGYVVRECVGSSRLSTATVSPLHSNGLLAAVRAGLLMLPVFSRLMDRSVRPTRYLVGGWRVLKVGEGFSRREVAN